MHVDQVATILICQRTNIWLRAREAVSKILAITLIFPFIMVMQFDASAEEVILRAELQADITEAYDLLQRYHPNLTTHTSQLQLDGLYERIYASVPRRSTKEQAYFALTELVGAVCDEHTQLFVDDPERARPPGGWPWFQNHLIVFDGRLFMEDPDTKEKFDVLSINDLRGVDIAAAVARRSPSDGCLDDEFLVVSDEFEIYTNIIAGMIGTDEPFNVELLEENSQRRLKKIIEPVSGFASSIHKDRYRSAKAQKLGKWLLKEGFQRPKLDADARYTAIDYRYSAGRNIAYLGIEVFGPTEIMAPAFENVLRDVIRKKPQAVILNLVDNPGGKNKTAMTLMAYLLPSAHRLFSTKYRKNIDSETPEHFEYQDEAAEQQRNRAIAYFSKLKKKNGLRNSRIRKTSFGKPDYKGAILVMLNPASGSNSIKVGAILRRLRNAKVAGSTTATNTVTSCSKAPGAFTLEHTGFLLRVPENCMHSPENRFNKEESLEPDIFISPLNAPLDEFALSTLRVILNDLDKKPID
ncbi:MAG: hypothetical protein GY789_18800 [Hyphomicrobiales bacterium]|nr:hypothetical protein [Hyphomicrobiales bacterium]